jgi:predicted acetyltransferase
MLEQSKPTLVVPTSEHLDSYRNALCRGWSPDNVRGLDVICEQLAAIERDPSAFLRSLDDPEARGPPITMPDGSLVTRLPSIVRWIWDGELAGSIGFRWQPGTSSLPAYVPGHIGFSIVPWKRSRGYAKHALATILEKARSSGLNTVELTTNPDNLASQQVMIANGAVLTERFERDAAYGGGETLRFRITL